MRCLQLVAMIKAAVPLSCERAIDDCLQIYGGEGVSQDSVLARALVASRSLRLADGPDEVRHRHGRGGAARVREGAVEQRALRPL